MELLEELDWTQMERGAVENFLATSGPLRSGLEKFVAFHARRMRDSCAMSMATVPRNPEQAADFAAKAQVLAELWELLTQATTAQEFRSTPSGANPEGQRKCEEQ